MIILASLINTVVVALAVLIHYQFLYMLTKHIPKLNKLNLKHNYSIVLGVFGALLAHSIEIWVFGLTYYLKFKSGIFGGFEGNFDGSFLDCIYFSFTSFTTLGYGDIAPLGDIRFLSGIESLTGLVLITWSASFLIFEMQRHWKVR